ncbi:Transposon Tf2-11 polyprotein [Vitis vinifera]|uniref:Transposon Tf2-11 polyprotein n=1 Tax=Vitis vinifera TaxID=29760 RepID=A0A438HUV0_VITVI|nr:Transposon Tf2-11 polyprotein [Vitis vinifera]
MYLRQNSKKWVVKLMGYDYEIIYRLGHENLVADAVSRKSSSPILLHLHVPMVTIWDEIKKAYEGDSYVQSLTRLANAQLEGPYAWRNGLLFFKGRKVKSETMPPTGLLQPLPIPCQVWDDITLDFIEGLPTSTGRDTILVVVDRLSKSAHFLALTHSFTAKIVAERFVEGVIKLHGLPKSIISDRDPIFISKFWQEFFQMLGTKLQLSSAYHPQTDGQTEVVNRCVKQCLRSMVHQWPRKWSNYLPWAELSYNTTYHASTGMTPFQALYYLLKFPFTIMGYNRQPSNEAHQKLASRFYRPYPMIQKIGVVAYKLQLPEGAHIHPVFHVSLLKNFVGELAKPSQELPPVNDEGAVILEPQHILDTR